MSTHPNIDFNSVVERKESDGNTKHDFDGDEGLDKIERQIVALQNQLEADMNPQKPQNSSTLP
jgi:hypothetical protein